jgi:hypothetical protein
MVGLLFFIRASVKDRTQQIELMAEEPEDTLLSQLKAYFDRRAYRVVAVDAGQDRVIFQGFVSPSWFLACFLTGLAAAGLFCFALVLSFLFPSLTPLFLALILLSPVAGVFYWQKAGRIEQVSLKLESLSEQAKTPCSLITVTAHRDELIQLQKALSLKPVNNNK